MFGRIGANRRAQAEPVFVLRSGLESWLPGVPLGGLATIIRVSDCVLPQLSVKFTEDRVWALFKPTSKLTDTKA